MSAISDLQDAARIQLAHEWQSSLDKIMADTLFGAWRIPDGVRCPACNLARQSFKDEKASFPGFCKNCANTGRAPMAFSEVWGK